MMYTTQIFILDGRGTQKCKLFIRSKKDIFFICGDSIEDQ